MPCSPAWKSTEIHRGNLFCKSLSLAREVWPQPQQCCRSMSCLLQDCPTLFLQLYPPAGFHFNCNMAHLTVLISSSARSLAVKCGMLCSGCSENPQDGWAGLEQGCRALIFCIHLPVAHSKVNCRKKNNFSCRITFAKNRAQHFSILTSLAISSWRIQR